MAILAKSSILNGGLGSINFFVFCHWNIAAVCRLPRIQDVLSWIFSLAIVFIFMKIWYRPNFQNVIFTVLLKVEVLKTCFWLGLLRVLICI